ncbi:hypothetical protein CK203_045834 [Vitis vinifera]|uniref:Uncharacterized protein n=1 Tax=Vitis vinifera TaxID=29760 RepID=A0A438FM33_VITVI|nr:hypothetical protein CK203_045834 [Vitis vinifera]
MPLKVKEDIREMLHEKSKAKVKKTAHIEEICAQLHGTTGAKHRHVMDKDDDEDEDEKVYMYLVDMHPDERDAYRKAVHASNATEWERLRVGSDSDLIQAVHDVFATLDPNAKLVGQFGNEPRWVKKKTIRYSNGSSLFTWMMNKDTEDSFQKTLNSHQEVDSKSVGQSSRPSIASTFAFGYDGSRGRTDDGGDNARGDIDWGMLTNDYSNKANVYPPYVMSYGQPSSSTNEEYGMLSYPLVAKMSYQVPYQMQGGFDMNTWVNLKYPIHVELVSRT